MKKMILIVCMLFIAFMAGIYLFIPTSPTLSSEITANCTFDAGSRILQHNSKWQYWWPAQKTGENLYKYKDSYYRIGKKLINGFEAVIYNEKDSANGSLQIITAGADSIKFQWVSSINFSNNPIKKITQYQHFKNIKNNVDELLAEIKKHFDKEENIYGFKIVKQKVTDANYISLKVSFNHYPSSLEVYEIVQSIKDYIKEKGGEENDNPILNIHTDDSVNFDAMVAIQTKREVNSNEKFKIKKMAMGNMLVAEVTGGNYTINEGEMELKNYISDYKKTSPAIPFQKLVTNRLLEPDTAKWVTKLYYPVFN